MADSKTFVIVGGGLGGAKAAEALREKGFDGKVALFAAGCTMAPKYQRPAEPVTATFPAGGVYDTQPGAAGAARTAKALGLPSDPTKLGALAPRANARLAAALVRFALDEKVRQQVAG